MSLSAPASTLLPKALLIAVVAAAVFVVASGFPGGAEHARANIGALPASLPEAPALPMPDLFRKERPSKGKFLVANPALNDPRFRGAVVLLFKYDANGAAGLIINRPTTARLAQLVPSLPGIKGRTDLIFAGGPVARNLMLMLIRSPEKPGESPPLFGDVYVGAEQQTLERVIAAHMPESQVRVFVGYAGWWPWQLEREVARGDWFVVGADADSIFEKKPSELWRHLYHRGPGFR